MNTDDAVTVPSEADFAFASETDSGNAPDAPTRARPAWRVLLVDDDEDVHRSTVFAIGQHPFQGRVVEFLHAYSAEQARNLLLTEHDLAIVVLDVVMESHHAGLNLI